LPSLIWTMKMLGLLCPLSLPAGPSFSNLMGPFTPITLTCHIASRTALGSALPASRIASTAEIGWSTDFGDRFDEFWSELQHQGCQVLLADRSRETLAWHFRIGLARRSVWILTATRRSRLVAYGVFDRLDHQKLGFTRIRFVDFQALRGEEELLRVFLASALERCRKERIDMLEITGGWLRRESLPAIAPPHGRALGSWTYYYKPSEEFRAALTGPAAWAPTSYDGDASL